MLDDIVDKSNNTVHRTIKMKPIEVMNDSYVKYNENPTKKYPKFKVRDNFSISKYKNIFAKGHTSNWSEEVFVISEIKNAPSWGLMLLVICMVKKLLVFYEKVQVFMKKSCKRLIKNNLE